MLQSRWSNFTPQRSSVVPNTQYVTIKVHLKNNVLEKKNSCAAPESLLSPVYGHFTDTKEFLFP